MHFIFNLLLILSFFTSLYSEIIQCKHLRELLPIIDSDTLVIFNINNVLTLSRQDAGSTPWAEEQIARIMAEKKVDKPHATNLFIPLWHDVLIASDVELYDADAEALVSYLQKMGIKVMALTNRYTEMAYPTHKNLRSVGIDFSINPPYPEDTWIASASPAKYVEGVIFNGLINFKGDTLAAFLKQINYTPKKLIYVEDKPKHLAQVGEKISALGIPFIGVHYGALEAQRETYQPELAKIQVRFHQDILDDISAQRLRYQRCGYEIPQIQDTFSLSFDKHALPVNITLIHSITELKKDLIPETLLVTELDQVLWTTGGSIGTRPFVRHVYDKQRQLGDTELAAQLKAERLFEKIQRRAKVSLLEERTVQFLNDLKTLNCWSVALSFRPQALMPRTLEQAQSVGLRFNSPFQVDQPFLTKDYLFSTPAKNQYVTFEEELSKLSKPPRQILVVSAFIEDLMGLKAVAERNKIIFKGRLLKIPSEKPVLLDDEILNVELEYLDHLLTNQDAAVLLLQS